MKKKKITAMFLVLAMVFTTIPAQGVMAEEMVLDSEETDGTGNAEDMETTEELAVETSENSGFTEEVSKEENSYTEKSDDFSDGADVNQGKMLFDDNDISLNQEFSMKSLIAYDSTYGSNYYLKLTIPENGRINLQLDKMTQIGEVMAPNFREIILYDKNEKIICNRKGWLTGPESYESGTVTVKPGEYILKINPLRPQLINDEATLKVLYQKASEYTGEMEDNDSYDTATVLESGVECDGDYSKESDTDIYKFTMEKPGKAEVEIAYKRDVNGVPEYNVVREDANGNTENISYEKGYGYHRLPAGNYYIRFFPEDGYYKENTVYTVKWTATYEDENSYEIENNDLQSMANQKKVNQWYTGNINNHYGDKKDVDWFRFDINKKSYIYAEMKTEREAEERILEMGLWKDGKILETDENTANPYLKTKVYLVDPGTYYICMKNGPQTWEQGTIPWDYSIRLVQRDYIDLAGLSLPESIKLKAGQSLSLTPEFEPADADDKEVEWISDSEDIVTVDQKGKVTAKKAGTANIIVCGKTDQEIQAVCAVTVEQDKPVSISKKTVSLVQGKNFQLKLNNAGKGVIWKSSSSSVAAVTQTGKITAKTSGKTTITARYKGKNYFCTVTVFPTQQGITYAKSTKTKTATLKWKKNAGAAGYQIQYSTDPKMKKNVKTLNISNRNTYTRTITGLQKKKRYYFRVRTYGNYKTQKLYGTFSSVKNCIIK